jgi:hypothetical protein
VRCRMLDLFAYSDLQQAAEAGCGIVAIESV